MVVLRLSKFQSTPAGSFSIFQAEEADRIKSVCSGWILIGIRFSKKTLFCIFLFREEPVLEGEEDDVISSKVQEDSESRDGR